MNVSTANSPPLTLFFLRLTHPAITLLIAQKTPPYTPVTFDLFRHNNLHIKIEEEHIKVYVAYSAFNCNAVS